MNSILYFEAIRLKVDFISMPRWVKYSVHGLTIMYLNHCKWNWAIHKIYNIYFIYYGLLLSFPFCLSKVLSNQNAKKSFVGMTALALCSENIFWMAIKRSQKCSIKLNLVGFFYVLLRHKIQLNTPDVQAIGNSSVYICVTTTNQIYPKPNNLTLKLGFHFRMISKQFEIP